MLTLNALDIGGEGALTPMDSTASRAFPRSERAPGEARRYVAEVLAGWNLGDRCSAILLAVSELVTNAVTHGQGLVEVRVALRRRVLHVEVEDEGEGLTAVPTHEPSAEQLDGRGLHIVDKVSDAWGACRPGARRSVVWFQTTCPG